MRFNALFLTSTLLFFASIDASSTKVDHHELQRFLRGDTNPHEEERVNFFTIPWDLADRILNTHLKIAKDVSNFDRRDGAEYNLLKSKDYEKLYKYMAKKTSKIRGDLDTHVAADLAVILGKDRFARILHASRNDPESKKAAVELQEGLIRSWEQEKPRRSASDLFDHLFPRTLGEKVPDDLLKNPLFDLWYKYVTTMMRQSKQNPALETVKILEARYGKDYVVTIFEASLKAGDTKDMASSLRVGLLNDLVLEETSIKDVFDTFEIGKIAVDDLLDSAAFKVVFKYSILYSDMNPDSRFDLINALTVGNRDASVAKMLYAAKVKAKAQEIERMLPRELQNLQYEAWYLADKGLSIQKMLGINGDLEKSDPAGAKIWKEFVLFKDNLDYQKARNRLRWARHAERLKSRQAASLAELSSL